MIESMDIVLESAGCPLGCRADDEIVLIGRDTLYHRPGSFPVVKCRCCGLKRTSPRPTPNSIGVFYPDNYGPYVSTTVERTNSSHPEQSWMRALVGKVFRSVFEFNTTRIPSLRAGRMLEIGCASGSFLDQMAAKGWEVRGIEFSPTAAEVARRLGYDVHVGPLETAPPPDEAFDLLVGWMVLEHLHEPIKGLSKLREWAKPGAWLVLSVPNAGSLEFAAFKGSWYALHVPAHLFHFTPDSIEKVLIAGGWRLEKVHHQRVISNLIGSMGLWLRDKGFSRVGSKLASFPDRSGRWSYLLFPLAWILGLVGQTGRMTVWARASDG